MILKTAALSVASRCTVFLEKHDENPHETPVALIAGKLRRHLRNLQARLNLQKPLQTARSLVHIIFRVLARFGEDRTCVLDNFEKTSSLTQSRKNMEHGAEHAHYGLDIESSLPYDGNGLVNNHLLPTEEYGQAAVPQHVPAPERAHGLALPAKLSDVIQQANAGGRGHQEEESGTDTDEDGQLIKTTAAEAAQPKAEEVEPPKPAPKKRALGTGRSRPGGGISMKDLIDYEILWPGEDVLSVEYKGNLTYATLLPEGHILCKLQGRDQRFESPSAFSIALKRLVNPARKADDGWKTVKYNGKFLDHYKVQLASIRLAEITGEAEEISSDGPPAKKAKVVAGSAQATAASRSSGGNSAADRTANSRQMGAVAVGSNLEDEATMIPCEHFRGEPGTSSRAQPFRVSVSPGAALLMDFHAHLSENEVVGLLAGTWNAQERLLRVERAFPVQEVQSERDTPTVEMNPHDEKAARQRLSKNHSLSVVGWYHSHPRAATHPSTLDVTAQMKQQKLHRTEDGAVEPFIGAIVSPYPPARDAAPAAISYFCVDYPKDRELAPGADPIAEGCLPMCVEVTEEDSPASEAYIANMQHHEIRTVVQRCATTSRRADMMAAWQGQVRLEKLKQSIATRLPGGWAPRKVDDFLGKIDAAITTAWRIFGQPAKPVEAVQKLRAEEEELEISDVSAGNRSDSTQ